MRVDGGATRFGAKNGLFAIPLDDDLHPHTAITAATSAHVMARFGFG